MKNRVGEKYKTYQGYEIEIIGYRRHNMCHIRFNDDRLTEREDVSYSSIKKGTVKNLFHNEICGFGYIGDGVYKSTLDKKVYDIWNKMIKRCYDKKTQEKYPTYKGVTICDEWCNFQNFAEWYYKNYTDKFHLDKDILVKGNKIYSPETCCFVPRDINNLLTKSEKTRGINYIGVSLKYNKFNVRLNKNCKGLHLGTFTTPEEAFEKYKFEKEKYIKEVAKKWKSKISEQVYETLINYSVKITD